MTNAPSATVRNTRAASVLCLVALLASCSGRSPSQPAPRGGPTPPSAPASEASRASGEPIPEHMQQHFTQVAEARDAIIAGRLDAARAAARALADRPPTATFPANWAPRVEGMRSLARALAEAPNLDEASLAVGRLALACGDCHADQGAEVTFTEAPVPTGEGRVAHMRRHQWATDRLWEGLVAPSTERWSTGANELAESPLHPDALASDRSVPAEIGRLGDHVHELARNAGRANTPALRAQLFGEMLATCNGCHRALEVR